MLTEEQLRQLLLKAGDTVHVEPSAPPVTALPPRRWRTALAAGAVAATVAGIAGVGLWLAGDDGPSGGVQTRVLGGVPDGRIPSVFAHTRESAAQLLEGLGLEVEYREEISCDPAGRAVGTDPGIGTPYEPGDTVTVLVAYQGPTTDCFRLSDEEWAFIDFATGRGPAPRFADTVELYVDGELVTNLPGNIAAEAVWPRPSALTELAAAAGQVLTLEVDGDGEPRTEYRTPHLQIQEGTPPDEFCSIPRPPLLGDREATTLTIDIPTDGIFHCPAHVSIYRTGGAIDAVVTWTERSLADPPQPTAMPDVVGKTVEEARNELTAAGYTVRVESLQTCDPREGIVIEQAPGQPAFDQDIDKDPDHRGVVVTIVTEVPHEIRDCAALAAAAEGFIRFARGGTPPAWAPEVRQLFGFARHDRISAEEADSPFAWSFCSGLGPEECSLSALSRIAQTEDVSFGEEWENYECELVDEGGLPPDLNWEEAVHLYPEGETDCSKQWEVALWVDDQGRITAVNLLVGVLPPD